MRSAASGPQPRHLLPPGAVRLCHGEERRPSGLLPARAAHPLQRCRQKPGGLCAVIFTGVPVCCPVAGGPPGPGAGERRARLLAASTLARRPAYCRPLPSLSRGALTARVHPGPGAESAGLTGGAAEASQTRGKRVLSLEGKSTHSQTLLSPLWSLVICGRLSVCVCACVCVCVCLVICGRLSVCVCVCHCERVCV